jgi:hypothetical protein
LTQAVHFERGLQLANELDISIFLETSAKTSFNVDETFFRLAEVIIENNKRLKSADAIGPAPAPAQPEKEDVIRLDSSSPTRRDDGPSSSKPCCK